MRKAKIICTMGPASREEPTLSRLVEAGMDVARLNLSHGTHDDHARAIVAVRKAAENAGRPVALLLDLQGPKIRVGKIEGGKVRLEAGAETTITVDPAILGTAQRFSCSYEGLPEDLSIGDPILINDGSIRLEVVAVEGKDVRCRVKVGGVLSDHKGINLPGTPVSIPAMTPKDIEDLKFGLEHEIDYVAMSFVRSADDIRLIKRYAPTTPVIAKLEKPQAVDRVDEIAQLAEGVMIARGDLGVEMPLERVPLIQKTAIERTNYYGKVAIVATQMLESMIVSPQPTRAEVSDVANAVLDGTDAVMLSAETAAGKYPVKAVQAMADVIRGAEKYQLGAPPGVIRVEDEFSNTEEAISRAVMYTASHLRVRAIVALTESGLTPLWMSRIRADIPIYAFTRHPVTRRRVTLYRGVYAVPFDITHTDPQQLYHAIFEQLLALGLVEVNDLVILTKGDLTGIVGGTNSMQIVRVTQR